MNKEDREKLEQTINWLERAKPDLRSWDPDPYDIRLDTDGSQRWLGVLLCAGSAVVTISIILVMLGAF